MNAHLLKLLTDVIDQAGLAGSCLDLAYDACAILRRGVEEGSMEHMRAFAGSRWRTEARPLTRV